MTGNNGNPANTVRAFWELMGTNDFHKASQLLAVDFECHWPQSGERILGRENYAEINARYPACGIWRFCLNTIVSEGERVVTDVSVTDGVTDARAITFHTVRDGLIIKQTEFWPDPFEPPVWRAALVTVG